MLNGRDEPEELDSYSTGSDFASAIEDAIYSPWESTPEPTPEENDQ